MFPTLLLLVMAAGPQSVMPTDGLLTLKNLDCVSNKVSADQAQAYFAMAKKGKEVEAFESAEELTKTCQSEHGWTDIQTQNAFRVSLMDGWLLEEGLIEKIQALGDFKPFLDKFYRENVKPNGRHILTEASRSGKMDKELTAAGYPEDEESRELAYHYWEWRGTLWGIEEDFRYGLLRRR